MSTLPSGTNADSAMFQYDPVTGKTYKWNSTTKEYIEILTDLAPADLQKTTTAGNTTDQATYFTGVGQVHSEIEAVVISHTPGYGRIGNQRAGLTTGAIRFMEGYSEVTFDNTEDLPTRGLRLKAQTLDVAGADITARAKVESAVMQNEAVSKSQLEQISGNITTNNLCQKVGDELYISSKFDSGSDWLCRFNKCMFNELYTFQRVGIIAETSPLPNPDNIQATPTVIFNEVGSDNIGPISVGGYGFISGNHSLNNDGVTKTAVNNSVSIYVDGKLLDNELVNYFNELLIIVENTIYDPSLLPSVQDAFIKERVSYLVKGCNIDVSVDLLPIKFVPNAIYYGMQSVFSFAFQKLYFGNSQYLDSISNYAIDVNVDSGNRTTYPDVDKIIISSTSKNYCQSMLLNTSVGLGANRLVNVPSDPLALSTGKVYFRLLVDKDLQPGESIFWNGCYSWFNQNDNGLTLTGNSIFAYKTLRGGVDTYAVDLKGSNNLQSYPIPYKIGKDISVVKKKTTSSVSGIATAKGVEVKSTAADNILFQDGRKVSTAMKFLISQGQTIGANTTGNAATATSTFRWNGQENDYSNYGTVLDYMLGKDAPTNKTMPFDSNQVSSWLNITQQIAAYAASLVVTNTTSTPLSKAMLNSTYPSAPVRFEVVCPNIGFVYRKYMDTGEWYSTNITILP